MISGQGETSSQSPATLSFYFWHKIGCLKIAFCSTIKDAIKNANAWKSAHNESQSTHEESKSTPL